MIFATKQFGSGGVDFGYFLAKAFANGSQDLANFVAGILMRSLRKLIVKERVFGERLIKKELSFNQSLANAEIVVRP